eukprot:gene4248-6027_t
MGMIIQILWLLVPKLRAKYNYITSKTTFHSYAEANDCVLEIFTDETIKTNNENNGSKTSKSKEGKEVLIYVHGGYWGSGKSWMYRVVTHGLGRQLNIDTMITLGYPVFPRATILQQQQCVLDAILFTKKHFGENVSIVLCGHSSGGNICALATLKACSAIYDETNQKYISCVPKVLIGLAGVYDIADHYKTVESRFLADLVPMKAAACGKPHFDECSPTYIAKQISEKHENEKSHISECFPLVILFHGLKDEILTEKSSIDFHDALKNWLPNEKLDIIHSSCDHSTPFLCWMDPDTPSDVITKITHSYFSKLEK